MKILNSTHSDFAGQLRRTLASRHDPAIDRGVEERVAGIIASIKDEGDAALMRWTNDLDRRSVTSIEQLEVSASAIAEALATVGEQVLADLRLAADRIRTFHQRQRESSWAYETEDGVYLGHRTVPLRAVGLYVPGGTAAYPSSVLMNAVPARVAGVDHVVMVTPAPGGVVPPAVLAAASIAGVDRIFSIGGAQAIAALAHGTATVPRVDKIVGPGNQWVASAKRQVFGLVDIDMIAGPSEVCVVATADGGATPAQLAADLLSQAEHDTEAMASFVSPDRDLVDAVIAEVHAQAAALPRSRIAQASIRDWGLAVVTSTLKEALEVAEFIAPEHLELVIPGALEAAQSVRSAGAIFCGPHTPEAVGDYIAGPNHVLPTNGTARFASPLGVYDFVKHINVLRFSRQGIETLGPPTARLADLEGLAGHAASVRRRLED